MRFYDLFSGVGGFRIGMQRAGHECVGWCEINDQARAIYEHHFGTQPPGEKEVEGIDTKKLPAFDCLCAGFPCPAFSVAGARWGFQDKRGRLFYEIIRIAKACRPGILFLENVKGLLAHDRGGTFARMLIEMEDLGYDIEWQVFNSKYYTPQTRERVFIIGHLREKPTRAIFPIGEISQSPEPKLQKVGNIDERGHNSIWGRVYDPEGIAPAITAKGGGAGAKTGLFFLAHTKGNIKQRYQLRDTTWTLDTTGSNIGVEQGDSVRKLTPLECERLQGLPDDWTFGWSDKIRMECIGNAVTVPVIQHIAESLKGAKPRG